LLSTDGTGEMSEKLKATVQEFYDRGWYRGDLSVLDELFSSDYQDRDAAAQTGTSGLHGARQFIETFRAAIPDLHVEIEDQYAEGSTVTTRWTATGTHEGTLMGVPATHRHVEVSGISIDPFDEQGRFAEGWGNWDAIGLLRQIGALPIASQYPRGGLRGAYGAAVDLRWDRAVHATRPPKRPRRLSAYVCPRLTLDSPPFDSTEPPAPRLDLSRAGNASENCNRG
jgi:steroid delta-isomerase-like uncharacterized protein